MRRRNVVVGVIGAALTLAGILIIVVWPRPPVGVGIHVEGAVYLDDREAQTAMRESGFTDEQIAAVTQLLRVHVDAGTGVVTEDIGNRLNVVEGRLSTRIAESQTDSTRWGIGTALGLAGLLVATIGRRQ